MPILSEVAILGPLLHGGQILSNLSNCGNVKLCIFLVGDIGGGGVMERNVNFGPVQICRLQFWARGHTSVKADLKIFANFVDFFVQFEDVLLVFFC